MAHGKFPLVLRELDTEIGKGVSSNSHVNIKYNLVTNYEQIECLAGTTVRASKYYCYKLSS